MEQRIRKRPQQELQNLLRKASSEARKESIFSHLDSFIPLLPYGEEGELISFLFQSFTSQRQSLNQNEITKLPDRLSDNSDTFSSTSKISCWKCVESILTLIHNECELWSVRLRLLVQVLT